MWLCVFFLFGPRPYVLVAASVCDGNGCMCEKVIEECRTLDVVQKEADMKLLRSCFVHLLTPPPCDTNAVQVPLQSLWSSSCVHRDRTMFGLSLSSESKVINIDADMHSRSPSVALLGVF